MKRRKQKARSDARPLGCKGRYTKPNIWDEVRDLDMPLVEPGARFFVFALNLMGCMTIYSCEGHPDGFYVIFKATLAQARRIKLAGFMSVELENSFGAGTWWSLRLNEPKPRTGHVDRLRWAADSWLKAGLVTRSQRGKGESLIAYGPAKPVEPRRS